MKSSKEIGSLGEVRPEYDLAFDEELMPEERKDWSREDYFSTLRDLLSEMQFRGHITQFFAVGTETTDEYADRAVTYVDEKLTISNKMKKDREMSDDEVVNSWGLNHGSYELIPKTMSVSAWRDVQGQFEQLSTLFDGKQTATSDMSIPTSLASLIKGNAINPNQRVKRAVESI
jgi:hypothetical protein